MSNYPYPGLRPFARDETDIFFGRDAHTDQLLEHFEHHHFLAVVGPSGCGKSSLVRTGLLPRLDIGFFTDSSTCWRIAELRPGNRPFVQLTQGLLNETHFYKAYAKHIATPEMASVSLQAMLSRGPLGLQEVYEQICTDKKHANLLVLVDQFEEIFRYYRQGSQDVADAFVALLLASTQHPNIYVVITMRADFLSECALFHGLPEAINEGLFLVPRLTREQLQEVIEGPARVFGGEVAPALVNALLNDLHGMGVSKNHNLDQLPILQHALMRMWQLASRSYPDNPILTLSHYEVSGKLKGALSQHADQAYHELSDQQQKVAEHLFRSLCERGNHYDTRRPTKLSEVAILANVKWERVADVVEVFRKGSRNFLLPPLSQPLTEESILDISHESLIRQWKRLKKWVDNEAESAEIYRRLEDSAYRWHKGLADLWSGIELEIALDWRNRCQPTLTWAKRYGRDAGQYFELALRFLEAGETEKLRQQKIAQQEQQKKIRRNRQRNLAIFIVSGCLLGLAVWAIAERYNAIEAKQLTLFESQLGRAVLSTQAQDFLSAKKALADIQDLSQIVPRSRRHARQVLSWFNQLMLGEAEYSYQNLQTKTRDPFYSVAVSADGQLIAAGGANGRILLFDSQNNQFIKRLQHPLPTPQQLHEGFYLDIQAVLFDPQGRWLISAGTDKHIIFWEIPSGKILHMLEAPGEIYALALSPDGQLLASGGEDKQVTLWDVQTKQMVKTLVGHDEAISLGGLAFNPQGESLASASNDGVVKLWHLKTFAILRILKGHTDIVNNIAFSSDGKWLATGSNDETIILWDLETGKLLRRLQGHQNSVYSVHFLPDKSHLVSGGNDRSLRIWDTYNGLTLRVLQGHKGGVNNITHYGNTLYSASDDGTVMRWDATLPYDEKVKQVSLDTEGPISTAISPDGQIVIVGFMNGELQAYSLPDVTLIWKEQDAHTQRISRITFDKKGNWLATASYDGVAKLWKVENNTLQLVNTLKGHKDAIYDISFSNQTRYLATASFDGYIGLFRLSSGRQYFYKGHEGGVLSVDFDKTGTLLLTSGEDGAIRIWNRVGKQLQLYKTLAQEDDAILSARFSPNNRVVGSIGTVPQSVRIYSFKEQLFKYALEGPKDMIYKLYFVNNQHVITASADATVRLWDLVHKLELFALPLPVETSHFPAPPPLKDFALHCTIRKGCLIAVPLIDENKLILVDLPELPSL